MMLDMDSSASLLFIAEFPMNLWLHVIQLVGIMNVLR
jgi:hypothetical protein